MPIAAHDQHGAGRRGQHESEAAGLAAPPHGLRKFRSQRPVKEAEQDSLPSRPDSLGLDKYARL